MTEKEIKKVKAVSITSPTVEETTNQQQQSVEKLTILKGITTSQIRKREKLSTTPAYCFSKTDQKEPDIPIIFRIKNWGNNWIKPTIKKGSYLQVEGHFANQQEYLKGCLMRKSFTAYSYQILNPALTSNQIISDFNKSDEYLENHEK